MATEEFDFADLEQDDSARVQFTHPSTGEDIPGAFVVVHSQDSDLFREESHKVANKCAEWSRRNRGKTIPNKDYAALDRQKVINCVKEISIKYKGEILGDAAEIFAKFPWTFEQTVAGIMDRSLFIKTSSLK